MQPSPFDRLIPLIGRENLDLLKTKKVLIIGIGGVGGYVAESLVRSGIEQFILVDGDSIEMTNLNRQIIALNQNMGESKVQLMKKRILDINKKCIVDTYHLYLDDINKDKIFNDSIDFIIDACDSVNTKKLLIKEALKRKINLISCMGTANKLDPTKLEITEIRKTINDPLARIIRKFIREEKITKKIMVLSSKEVPLKNKNILGSNIFVPAVAGLLIGSYVINQLIK